MNLRLSTMPQDLSDLAKEWPLVFMLDLPPKANIVVVGCYEGRATDLIRNVYPDLANIHGFDPQIDACSVAIKRFQYDRRIHIHAYGLGVGDFRAALIATGTHDAAIAGKTDGDIGAVFCDAERVLSSLAMRFDLLFMNIEGYEYQLLPYLIKTGVLGRVDRLVVQFHPSKRRDNDVYWPSLDMHISMMMESTKMVDQYPQWVYWKRP